MINLPLISVIVPVYNVENCLAESLNSIIQQSYTNLEILLIDDGSTDRSGLICDEFAERDNRVHVIHQENHGIAFVRNLGVKEAHGEIICWMDSDDYAAQDMIETLYNLLVKYDADMSICNYTQGPLRNYQFDSCDSAAIEEMDARTAQNRIYRSAHDAFIMAASWAKLIRKSVYNGLEYPDGLIFEDIYMSHKLIQQCRKIVYSDSIKYYYFQWPESILGKKLYLAKLDYLGAFEERIYFYRNLGYTELEEKAYLQYLHSLMWEFSRTKDILHNREKTKEIVKAYRKYYKWGLDNTQSFAHETKGYMAAFYLSPYGLDLVQKIKGKLLRK